MSTTNCNKVKGKLKNNASRIFLMLLISLMALNPAKALVSNYTFGSSAGTYTPLVGGTVFQTGASWDDAVSGTITIPFTFTYNNVNYSSLTINSNGFITLGGTSSSNTYCGLQASPVNSIAAYGTDLRGSSATSTIQYGVVGASPNRQFVIQWDDCRQFFSATTNHWSFQIILNETTNQIQVVMGTVTCTTTLGANNCADVAGESGNVGLLGSSTQDFNIRSVTNGTDTWATSVAGGAINAVCNLSSTNFPASGQTYTWTPAPPTPMSFVSTTTSFVNNLGNAPKGAPNVAVIKVQVVVTGSLSPFNISSLNLSTAGCTNAAIDISNAKVFFTGAGSSFSTATQFGATAANPNGSYTISGSANLVEGTNYFWITYDIANTATTNNTITGCCTQITGTGAMGAQTPTVTCPAGSQNIILEGIWTAVAATAPHANKGVMLLLSDGKVMCMSDGGGGEGKIWDILTPDIHGSYINGTWSSTAPMTDDRLFFASQVLKDGRVYVAGGEYGSGLQKSEVYNPLTNTWTTPISAGVNISDANSAILEDGRVLQALVTGNLRPNNIWNPATNTYSAGPSCIGIHNESVWIKLPDNSILFVDRLSTNSERYIPATNTWVADATVPVNLYDPFGSETGAAVLLPNGKAFFMGSQGTTAIYTPSGNSSPGSWVAGPNSPNGTGAPDAPLAMMANGKVLCALSNAPTSSATLFIPPTYFYEYDYLSNSFTQVHAYNGSYSLPSVACFQTNFLDLPDGTVLYAENQSSNSSHYYVYNPLGTVVAAGKPAIAAITQTSCSTFQISGTQFNGISEGACYGDDWQMASNYPIIRLTNGSNVYYCRSFNWNSTGVRRGNLPDNCQFTLPAGLPVATYSLVVVANGIASDPVSFTPVPYLTSTLTAPASCSNVLFSYLPALAPATASFTWTRAAVAGISNAAVVTPQTSNPGEVLINTTASPVTVVYEFVITSNGCSNNQQVTVVVNPSPIPVITGNTPICIGSPAILDAGAGYAGYSWSTLASTQTISVSTAGSFSVTVTDGNGCTGSASVNTSIQTYNITTIAGANGSITPGTGTVNCGSNNTYTIMADACYHIADVTIDGISQGAVGSVDVNNVTANHTVSATFAINTYTITVNAGANGSITPATGTVNCGSNNIYTIAADACYHIADVTIDGISQGAVGSVDVNNVTANHTVAATFAIDTYTITVNAAANGSITPGTGTVNCGSNNTYTITADPGYAIADVTIDGVSQGAVGSVNVNNVTANHTVAATFVQNSFTITSSAGAGGSISPTGATSVNAGNNQTYTITANTCFSIADVVVDGVSQGAISSYIFTNVTTNHTIVASFTQNGPYAITVTAGVNGSITPGTGNVTCGNNASYTITPIACYHIVDVLVDGVSQGAITSYTFTNVQAVHTISATFALNASLLAPVITGIVNVCPYIGTGDPITYTFNSAGATSYSYVLPPNVTLVGSTANSITLNFLNGFVAQGNKQIRVTALSACGNSPMAIYYLLAQTPGTPQPITGNTNVCPIIGTANTYTYSIPAVTGATSYIWTGQAGTTVITNNGTSANVSFSNSFTTSAITVQAVNGCGASNVRSITITRNAPSTPGPIAGTTNACEFIAPNGIAAVYSVAQIPGVTYNWIPPAGSTSLTGQGTNSISFIFPAGFTSGTLSVTAINGCGTSSARSLSINKLNPGTPGVIDVIQTHFCGESGGREFTYTIASMPSNTTSMLWTVPAGGTILSGQGTVSITVSYTDAAVNGAVTAQAVNNCGVSVIRSVTVKLAACPVAPRTSGIASKGSIAPMPSAKTMEVNIFPNPTVSDFKMEVLTSGKEEINVRVIDNQGKLFKSFKLMPNQTIALGAELHSGVYLIEVRQGTMVKTTKVVKF